MKQLVSYMQSIQKAPSKDFSNMGDLLIVFKKYCVTYTCVCTVFISYYKIRSASCCSKKKKKRPMRGPLIASLCSFTIHYSLYLISPYFTVSANLNPITISSTLLLKLDLASDEEGRFWLAPEKKNRPALHNYILRCT